MTTIAANASTAGKPLCDERGKLEEMLEQFSRLSLPSQTAVIKEMCRLQALEGKKEAVP